MSARPYAVFDIDGTVIRWQLYHAVVSELAGRGKLAPDAEQVIDQARMSWKQRTHRESFKEYEQQLLAVYHQAFAQLQVDDYLAAVDAVFDEYKDQVYRYTRDLIRELKAKNYLLFAISGSQQEIVAKLADYYGFDDCIGQEYERNGDSFTGKRSGVFHQKDRALQSILERHQTTKTGSICVGDSEGDILMLEQVERPIAFNPSALLFEHAQAKGWEVVLERKNMIYHLKPEQGRYVLDA